MADTHTTTQYAQELERVIRAGIGAFGASHVKHVTRSGDVITVTYQDGDTQTVTVT